ncbi:Zinc finger protein 184-like Protein [Tribolium castaneum]|uniref:Zinc finger protein 184-like Protein n=1 Tax=Tribolium castaneum TaxID=7070 RepID=D6WSU9_TRICA|nr:PREDICTED: zinc finger protein 883 [Tribolium castaneum]EFA06347.2 Zinc finger protein 184-like Protein [Tribolium castaneum]|eukprot:XP_008196602.1 PREDICTED: zinc finger protein 883 [Tribolium castaneum]
MRHVRLPGQNIKKLTFRSQIGDILKELNKTEGPQNDDSKPSCSFDVAQKRRYNIRARKKMSYIENLSVKKTTYKCKVCSFTERTKKVMLKHLQTHVGAPLSCFKCKKTFNGSVAYKWHLGHYCTPVFYDKWKYKCSLCPREFVSKRTLASHLQGHKRNNCAYCDKVLTRRVHLIRHLLEVHSIKLERDTYKCDHCEKRYIKKCSLYYHLKQHLPDKYICLECGKVSETVEENEEHKKQHDLQKHFKCAKCGDRFSRRQQYLFHLKRHNQYKCVTCDEFYASRTKVIKHKQQGHEVEGLNPRFICPHCPVAFHRETRFHIHMRKHSEDNRSINCKYCKKTFVSPYAYYKHCITINHEKFSPEINDIACEKCGKHFAKRYDLRQHLYRVHNTSKQFVSCQYCNYKTVHKCNMDRHVALHFRKSNQYTCEYCGKNFDSIANLNDHITYNHIQTRQFKCDKCDKSFKRNSELARHQDSHSDERPHVCTLCGKTYKRLNHLKRHEKQAHHIVKETRRIKNVSEEQKKSESNCENLPELNYWIDSEDLYRVYNDVSLTYGMCEGLEGADLAQNENNSC